MKPITSQMEADRSFQSIVNMTVNTLKISKDEAERRVKGLLQSGMLDHGSPEDPRSKILIDQFMQIPSRSHKEMIPEMQAMAKMVYGK